MDGWMNLLSLSYWIFLFFYLLSQHLWVNQFTASVCCRFFFPTCSCWSSLLSIRAGQGRLQVLNSAERTTQQGSCAAPSQLAPSQLATCQFSCVPCCHGDGSWEETNGPTAAQRHLVTCWKLICSHICHRLTLCLSWESNIISSELLWSWHFLHWARYLIKQSADCLITLHISRLSEVRFTQMPQSFEVLPVSMVLAPSTNHTQCLANVKESKTLECLCDSWNHRAEMHVRADAFLKSLTGHCSSVASTSDWVLRF